MKLTMAPTPKNLNLVALMKHFSDDEKARTYLEAMRWPRGVVCPHCGVVGNAYKIAANPAKKVRLGLCQCKDCGKQFTVTVGTVFEDSKVPLHKWLMAWYLICASKKGIAALELQRLLGIGSYRTAWFMLHRIRESLKDPIFDGSPLRGIVEADETYVGGKTRMNRKFQNKAAVVTVVERDGRARSTVVDKANAETIPAVLKANVDPSAVLMTDEARHYEKPGQKFAAHHAVAHTHGEYVRGRGDRAAHTNNVESFFGLLKRGHYGVFHRMSKKYMQRYLIEFDYRYSHRRITDGSRAVKALQRLDGKRLKLADLKKFG